MLSHILANHRGPYKFLLIRPKVGPKPHFFTSEWLKGDVRSEDVGEEAMSLLSDPRDTIVNVGVWSERESCFISVIRSEKDL